MANKYDFFAPYLDVRILNSDNSVEVPLWFGDNVSIDKLRSKFDYRGEFTRNLALVTELQVELNLGSFFTMQVTLDPTFEDALEFMNSDLMRYPSTFLKAQFGYVGSGSPVLSPVYTGELKEPDFSLGQDIKFTLKAQASYAAHMTKTSSTRSWKNTSRLEIVEALLAGNGKPKRSIKLDITNVSTKSESFLRLVTDTSYSQAGKNDMMSLKDILDQCLCTYYFVDDPKTKKRICKIYDKDARFSAAPSKVFRLFATGQFQGELGNKGVYPIVSVSTQSKTIFLRAVNNAMVKPSVDDKKKEASVKAVDIDKDPKLQVPVVAPKGSPSKKGAKSPKPVPNFPGFDKQTKGGGEVYLGGDKSLPTQDRKNEADAVSRVVDVGLKLSVETIGIPDLEPGQVVEVQGFGGASGKNSSKPKIDGNYSILKVTHVIGTSGFVTRWEGIQSAGYLHQTMQARAAPNNTANTPISDGLEVKSKPG